MSTLNGDWIEQGTGSCLDLKCTSVNKIVYLQRKTAKPPYRRGNQNTFRTSKASWKASLAICAMGMGAICELKGTLVNRFTYLPVGGGGEDPLWP